MLGSTTSGYCAFGVDCVPFPFLSSTHMVMDSDDHVPKHLKRPRSPSTPPSPVLSAAESVPLSTTPSSHTPSGRASSPPIPRPPKRLRKSHASDPISAATLSNLGIANPLNRRVLKRAAKRERKALRFRTKVTGSMEVDDESAGGVPLGETFMA